MEIKYNTIEYNNVIRKYITEFKPKELTEGQKLFRRVRNNMTKQDWIIFLKHLQILGFPKESIWLFESGESCELGHCPYCKIGNDYAGLTILVKKILDENNESIKLLDETEELLEVYCKICGQHYREFLLYIEE